MAEEKLHTNHRQRMLQKLRKYGLDAFADHEVIEMALYLSIPRGDTNPIAHRLLRRFGSLHAVFEAPIEELERVEGVGSRSAETLHILYLMFHRYRRDRVQMEQNAVRLNTIDKLGNYFVPQFSGAQRETMLVAYLDNAARVLRCEELEEGAVTQVQLDLHKVVREAFVCNAAGIVLAHNHPNGVAVPSNEDIELTRYAAHMLEELKMHLIEHFVIAGDQYYAIVSALKREGLMGRYHG